MGVTAPAAVDAAAAAQVAVAAAAAAHDVVDDEARHIHAPSHTHYMLSTVVMSTIIASYKRDFYHAL